MVQESLGHPTFDSLNDLRIYRIAINELDAINNYLGLTGNPWNLSLLVLTVQAGADYQPIVSVGDFSTPFAVETADSSCPSFVSRPIPILGIADLESYAGAGTQIIYNNNLQYKHTALAVAFTEMPGQPGIRAARFAPIPNQSADYNIFYQPNVIRPSTVQDPVIKFPQYESYLLARVQVNALQYAEWPNMSPDNNAKRRAELIGDPGKPGSMAFRFLELDKMFVRMRRKSDQHNQARLAAPGRILRSL